MAFHPGHMPVLTVLLLLLSAGTPSVAASQLAGRVVDENGRAVVGAVITLTGRAAPPAIATSGESGRFIVPALPPGSYDLRAEKRGYYAFTAAGFQVPVQPIELEIVLNHEKEFEETVNVVYSAPIIDPQQTEAQATLTAEDVIEIPYPATHDFRNALPLMPGVIKDNAGRVHINGGGENQVYYVLDGFNISNPVTGTLESRIPVDSLRGIQVQSSRYSAEFGKGSAGMLALETSRGDDSFRFLTTNFLPSFETHDGLMLSNWMPRATISGPIVRGRAWYFSALDLQYDSNLTDELPSGANTSRNWFGSSLTALQVNLTGRNILSSTLLFNLQDSIHWGMSPLDPLETTRDQDARLYFVNLKDQAYFQSGWVLETGLAVNRQTSRARPMGGDVYRISPAGRSGNYFMSSSGTTDRVQAIGNLVSPFLQYAGRHVLKLGMDAGAIRNRYAAERRPYEVRRLDGSLVRSAAFLGHAGFSQRSSEIGGFIQDRWSPADQILVEAGFRLDWDQILRRPLASPRLAATLSPRRWKSVKLSAGVGLYFDATNLALLARRMDQSRVDTFYAADGTTVREGPAITSYIASERLLDPSRSINWSLGWEQQLSRSFLLRSGFIRRHGYRGWAYEPDAGAWETGNVVRNLHLRSHRKDSFSQVEVTLQRNFRQKYEWMASYARSSARSTAVLDYSLENPLFGRQAGGPLDWDAPNRLISSGFLPAPWLRKFTLAWFLEWHTGFPFGAVNESQELVSEPNSRRFPDYFSVNLHLERRFRFMRYEWALRAGFNNLTGRRNPAVVNNNIDSPDYGTFFGGHGRTFTGRIRLLGKG